MTQKPENTTGEIHRQILDFCKHAAGPCKIAAACQSDDYTIEVPSAKSTVQVLLVLHDFQPRLISYVRSLDGRNVVFFVVDKWIFERDVDRGFLGEALASMLIFPHTAIVNAEYFKVQEVILKKRFICELLQNMVTSYPELSYSLRIKPEYFMYEVILNRVRVFPPLANGASHFLCGDADKTKVNFVLRGYKEALTQLAKEENVAYSDGFVMISKKFITASKSPKIRFTNAIKNAPRALFAPLFEVFPQLLNFLTQNAEAFFRFQTPLWKKEFDFARNFVDPEEYVYVPTGKGFVSLADKMDIRTFAKRALLGGEYTQIEVQEFGGVLNDVFLMKAHSKGTVKKILVKRFKDWTSFKWFPLSMWSIGVRSFSVLGRSRLERESAINELLEHAGFNVPKVLHVSNNERLIFMEFLEGEDLSNAVKRIAITHSLEKVQNELILIAKVGETYARVHSLNVALGDTKPENVMIDKQGKIFLLDFEQASRDGDKAWDIACFLYYCGHYMPLNGEQKAEAIAKAFVEGYLRAGGEPATIKCAGIPKYSRVFSIFTLPGVIRIMSKTCKNIEGPKCKKW